VRLPGQNPRPYAVFVDERDRVWLSDWGSNSILRFDPDDGTVTAFPLPSPNAEVRQLLGRPGEIWAPESGADRLFVIRY
jgi:virginiamycin B lyase